MRTIFILSIILIAPRLFAQSDSTKTQGEIVTGEVIIEKDNKIIMPQVDKIYLRSTPKSFGNEPINVKFQINEPTFDWPNYKSDVPFRTLDEQYPVEAFQNYVKLGYGNYGSPLFEAGVFQSFGTFDSRARLYYESFNRGPVNDENSGNATGGIALTGIYRKNTFSIAPSISFQNSKYSFYGNADRTNTGFDASNPEDVSLNDLKFDISMKGGKGDINYIVVPSITYVNQHNTSTIGHNKETGFEIASAFDYKIDNSFKTGFDFEAYSSSYDGGLAYSRSLVNISPWLTHQKDNLTIKAGFLISSGKVISESKTSIYPQIRAEYDFTDQWSVYGTLSGGQSWNSLSQLLNQNHFLDDSLSVVNSETTIQFGGGIKGAPLKNIILETELKYQSIKGMPFFTPSPSDSARYTLSYDTESVDVVSLKSKLAFMPTAASTYGLSVELNGYTTESLDKPWHKPTYIIQGYTSHNIQEKLIISAYLTSMGGIRAPANVDFGYMKLPAFVDLGFGAKYLITTRASVFIDANNLLNNEYERYLGYPTRGITFKIGGQYRF